MNVFNFLTDREKNRVKNRIEIIDLLNQGKSIRQISQQLNVSSTTVVQVGKNFKSSNNPKVKKQKSKKGTKTKYFFG